MLDPDQLLTFCTNYAVVEEVEKWACRKVENNSDAGIEAAVELGPLPLVHIRLSSLSPLVRAFAFHNRRVPRNFVLPTLRTRRIPSNLLTTGIRGWCVFPAPHYGIVCIALLQPRSIFLARFCWRRGADLRDCTGKMGALKYLEELSKKKQSDVVRFLLRVRCWEVS